jgi:hypothetical protein|nr:MAG TPA: hypothetical protein [Myoviridae sp. ctRUJ25]
MIDENKYPELDIGVEHVSISLENPTFDIYYRKYGIRRPTQLNQPVFHDLTDASLPKNAIYHYNPESELLFGPLENNPWFANDDHLKFISHVVDWAGPTIGPVLKKPAPTQLYIQSYRRKHRSLKLLRDFFMINRQSNMVIIKNYCLLNHLYRYRPNILLKYYKFYNFYSTIMNHINDDGNKSDRQQFFEIRLPKLIHRRGIFNMMSKLYTKGMSRQILRYFGDEDSLLLLHLWMWLGPQRTSSIFNKIQNKNLIKVNLIFTDSGKFCILNLGELDKWRNGSDELDGYEEDNVDDEFSELTEEERKEIEKGERPERIQIRFYNLLNQFLTFRTAGNTQSVISVPKYDLNEEVNEAELDKEDDEELGETPIQQPLNSYTNVPEQDTVVDESQPHDISKKENLSQKKDILPALPEDPISEKIEDISDSPDLTLNIPTSATDLQPEDKNDPVIVNKNETEEEILDDEVESKLIDALDERLNQLVVDAPTYEEAPLRKAHQMLKDGMISAREYERVVRLSEAYKTIPTPYPSEDPNETVESFMNIPEKDIKIIDKIRIPDNDFILDKSMLEATTETMTKQYIKKVLPKNIIQSIMAIQKNGYLVTDIQRDQKNDVANKIDILRVKVQKIGGNESTVVIKVPHVDEDGTMLIGGSRYKMLFQRVDLPLRKVSSTEVALTSYYGKLFIEKSTKRKYNLDKYLITQLQSKIISGGITNVTYRNVFDKRKPLPTVYQIIARKFRSFELSRDAGLEERDHFACCFDYQHRSEILKVKPEQLTQIELDLGGIVFARSLDNTNSLFLIDPATNEAFSSLNPKWRMPFHKFFDISTTPPLEMAELNIFSKMIPMGIVLGYYLGLSNLLKLLKVTPRKVFRGQMKRLQEDEFSLDFADESWIFKRGNPSAELILSGFMHYQRYLHDYSVNMFDNQDVYGALLRDMGLGSYQETELRRIKDGFIDEITKSLLIEMNEPTEFIPLLIRAVQLLTTMQSNNEINMDDMVIKGYQRIAGHVYREIMKAIKQDDNKRQGNRTKLEMSPEQVLRSIMQDSSVVLVDSINPLHQLKEHANVTFTGDGGRSKRSMVSHTRSFHETDLGVISEATVDNQNVGVTTFLSGNPSFTDVYGMTKRVDPRTSGSAPILSDASLLYVGSTKDDQQRSFRI